MKKNLHPFSHKTAYMKDFGADYPELTDGFDLLLEAEKEGIPVASYCTDIIPAGTYALHVHLKAVHDTGTIYLFAGRKQMYDKISLKEGESYARTFYLSVTEIIPRFHSHTYFVERIFFSIAGARLEEVELCFCYSEPKKVPTVFLGGDSTVADQPASLPYHPGGCYASWGQDLPYFIGRVAAVENQARSGLTTETFWKEGHFKNIQHHMGAGDFCLLQFGHNDQKLPHLQANKEYPQNLIRYVEEVRQSGAIPVLLTPLARNIWREDGTYNDLLNEHADAVIDVAQKKRVKVIDLHKWSVEFVKEHGLLASQGYYHPGDYTHTNEYGAYLFASYVAKELNILYPGTFYEIRRRTDFSPPENLWELVEQKSNQVIAPGERESFDRMEKSVDTLLQVLRRAKA